MGDVAGPESVRLGVATMPAEAAVKLPVESVAVATGSAVVVSIRSLVRTLGVVIAAILAAHLVLQLTPLDFMGSDLIKNKVHIDAERSVPTYLAALLLTACGMTAWWLSRLERLPWPGWTLLAVVLTAAGVEEVAAVHEQFSAPVRSALGVGGWLEFAWIVVGLAVALVVAAVFLRPFLALPTAVKRGLALGTALFLVGSIGMEIPGGRLRELVGIEGAGYVLVSTLEEGLEFAGALVWLGTLVGHLRKIAAPPTLRVAD